jgi:phage-related protein
VRSKLEPGERPVFWVASSKKDLLAMPEPAIRAIGVALGVAQYGGKYRSAKPWKGEGPGVLEVVEDFDGDTFRAIYTVKFAKAVYVLHCFQKKSPTGIKTAKSDIELVGRRLKAARREYEERYGKASK